MAIEQIEAAEPTVVPAISEKTFNLWRLKRLEVQTHDPNRTTELQCVFVKSRKDENGVWEDAPASPENRKVWETNDLLALTAEDEGLETLLNAVIGALKTKAGL